MKLTAAIEQKEELEAEIGRLQREVEKLCNEKISIQEQLSREINSSSLLKEDLEDARRAVEDSEDEVQGLRAGLAVSQSAVSIRGGP
jgi:archaellum component FlaC